MRSSEIVRDTKETEINIKLNIDGSGVSNIDTGIGFLDHMLTLLAFHGKFDLDLKCKGDLGVDSHHTAEDIGILLGKAFNNSIGNKLGIKRYSSVYLPMDEALCRIALDISGRPFLVYNVELKNNYLGNMDTQNFEELIRAFVMEAKITLHIELLYGVNDHHKIESVFKGLGRVLADASSIVDDRIASSKGVI